MQNNMTATDHSVVDHTAQQRQTMTANTGRDNDHDSEPESSNTPTMNDTLESSDKRMQVVATTTMSQEPNEKRHAEENPESIVPQLSSSGITYGELETAIKVLNAIATLNPKNRRIKQKQSPNTNGANDATNDNCQQSTSFEDGIELYKQSNLRPFRKALSLCIDMHQRTMYNGLNEADHYDKLKQERSLKRQKMSEKDLYRKHIETTLLRKGRVDKLQAALQEYEDEERSKLETIQAMMIPDGHVDVATSATTTDTMVTNHTPLLIQSESSNGDMNQSSQSTGNGGTVVLPCLRSCYVCKIRYRELHHFYDQLCPSCAAINWEKRYQSFSLDKRVAIVTGSRVKIGYQTCLKLLRAGCIVVATTRFPNAAIETYRKESDFEQWKHNLHIFGLDLRDVVGIELLTRYLKQQFADTGIDILINNACQTIRRPSGYYAPAIQREQQIWDNADNEHKLLLSSCIEFENLRRQVVHSDQAQLQHQQKGVPNAPLHLRLAPINDDANTKDRPIKADANTLDSENDFSGITVSNNSAIVSRTNWDESVAIPSNGSASASAPFETTGISHSAAMSQMVILPEDVGVNEEVLPRGISDINGQQLDLRTTNSWLLKMEQVSTPELMECMFINAIAPFVLNARLKPLLTHPNTDERQDRFIINVSAMEGKFYRYKTECHPHTNMAKAALNMLTRTSADDLAKNHRIYMNSVDTGWINDENPLEKASRIFTTNLFQTPIDEIDAAARILDPIFTGIKNGRDGSKIYGKFLKDYKESEW